MHAVQWIALFRQIPASFHDGMVVSTDSGTDVVMQRIVSLEDNVLVLVGRLQGSTEQGHLFLIPYEQISNLQVPRRLNENELQDLLGKTKPTPPPDSPPPEAPPAPTQPRPVSVADQATPSKSLLLARLRARLNKRDAGMG